MSDLPHDQYIDTVNAALTAAGLGPSDGFTETPDGEQLDAVLNWRSDHPLVAPSELPHGMLICWSQYEGWEYAWGNEDGSNSTPRPLVREFIPSPDDIVTAVGTLLHGADDLPIDGTPWEGKDELSEALAAWEEEVDD